MFESIFDINLADLYFVFVIILKLVGKWYSLICVPLSIIQEFIEIKSLLLLSCTINYILYIPLSHIKEYRRLEKVIHQLKRNWMVAPFSKLGDQMWVGFCLNTRKHFFLKTFFYKTVLGIFKVVLFLRDRDVLLWQTLGILNIFSNLTLTVLTLKLQDFNTKMSRKKPI